MCMENVSGHSSKQDPRARLPKVGDKVVRTPEIGTCPGILEIRRQLEGVVVYVHPEHLWYRVRFTTPNGATFHECFKIPG